MRTGKRTVATMIGIATATVLVTAGAARAAKPGAKAEGAPAERGAFIVQVGGCNHCHTPWMFDANLGMPVPDMKRMLSGHPADAPDPEGKAGKRDIGLIGPTFTSFAMPFGVVYAPNLTPDKDTGLGTWTEKMFVDAIKNGKHMGGNGRAILPPPCLGWTWRCCPRPILKCALRVPQVDPGGRSRSRAAKVCRAVYAAITENFEKLKKAMQARAAKRRRTRTPTLSSRFAGERTAPLLPLPLAEEDGVRHSSEPFTRVIIVPSRLRPNRAAT